VLIAKLLSGKYDFAVIDGVTFGCLYAIPLVLNIPYGSISVPFFSWHFRVPRFPSFVPTVSQAFTDRMSFGQRLKSFDLDVYLMFKFHINKLLYFPHHNIAV
jgi:hypothetical protein